MIHLNSMKKILIVSLAVVSLFSCSKDLSSLNKETKRAANVPAGTLFANGVRNLADVYASASVNVDPMRFVVKHWAQAVYQEEAQYDFSTRNIPQTWWTTLYRDVLADLKESGKIVTANTTLDAAVKSNQLAMIDIMQVYSFYVLVNSFGDIPYSEALDATKIFPKYDDAKTVYTDLLTRLVADIGKLDASKAGFSSSEDLIYKGNVTKWKLFANSLRMKMGMLLADSDNGAAKSQVEAAVAGSFTSASDNTIFNYLAASPNTNPLYTDIVLGGRGDYVAAKDLMDQLIRLNDPRKSLYFGTNNDGIYIGGTVGSVNTYSAVSKPSTQVSAATAPLIFLDYVETEFFKAEAVERGYNVGGTAADHYNNAIKASILAWGGTAADADAYLAQPEVAYATAAGTWKQKIGFQKWIALYNRPFDGWTEYRRFDFPVLTPPVGAKSGFPNRYSYPANEQQLNPDNYTSAAAKFGGDKVESKLFWDKF